MNEELITWAVCHRDALENYADRILGGYGYYSGQDVLQDVLTGLATTTYVVNPAAYASYLRRAVRNYALTALRRRRPFVPLSAISTRNGPEIVEVETVIPTLLNCLREPYRETARLFYVEDLSIEQVARRQCIPSGTVKSRLSEIRRRLRQRFPDPDILRQGA